MYMYSILPILWYLNHISLPFFILPLSQKLRCNSQRTLFLSISFISELLIYWNAIWIVIYVFEHFFKDCTFNNKNYALSYLMFFCPTFRLALNCYFHLCFFLFVVASYILISSSFFCLFLLNIYLSFYFS